MPLFRSHCASTCKSAVLVLLLSLGFSAKTQSYTKDDIHHYIDKWWTTAVEEMEEFGIPASISLAQGILESAAGQSRLARDGNNHFGIKCHRGWEGKKIFHDDDRKGECFRKYRSAAESWTDHSDFLHGRDRYSSLFTLRKTDYKGWAKGLKKAGYATNPRYADLLINLIERYDLSRYDKMGQKEVLASQPDPLEQMNLETPDARATVSAEAFYFNRIRTVQARAGDTPESIAGRYDIKLSWICRYNNMGPSEEFAAGSNVYLQPKRRKGSNKYHIVKAGESMQQISQINGVNLDLLYKRNLVVPGFQPEKGEKIYLRSKRKTPPRNRKAKPNQPESKATTQINSFSSSSRSKIPTAKKKIVQRPEATTPTEAVARKSSTEEATGQKSQNESLSTRTNSRDTSPEKAEKNITVNTTLAKESRPAAVAVASKHTVQPGETLYSLSRRYKTSVDHIRGWNRLDDNNIRIGEELVVGWQ